MQYNINSMNRTVSVSGLLIFGLIFTFGVIGYYIISAERLEKKALEIERIIDKTYDDNVLCEQYVLVAIKAGWFPCLGCDASDSIYLYEGEARKYGKTCNGEFGRYPNGLPYKNLLFRQQVIGTEKECLIAEKEKIYNYPNLPECRKRNFILLRPPGNRIDR